MISLYFYFFVTNIGYLSTILVGFRSLLHYLTTVNTDCTVTHNNDNILVTIRTYIKSTLCLSYYIMISYIKLLKNDRHRIMVSLGRIRSSIENLYCLNVWRRGNLNKWSETHS